MNKNKWIGPILVAVFLAGLSLLLYPSFSDYWNSMHQGEVVVKYAETAKLIEDDVKDKMLAVAAAYNAELTAQSGELLFSLTEEQEERYNKLLDPLNYGLMGYIDVPSVKISLPVYHGVSDSVLAKAVGHLEWSSLPVGGEGTHCVLSSHRGLPSARLFTDLDKVIVGDVFMLTVLDEVLTYEIDQILIVEPTDMESLRIEEGKDYCTLVTCTPYGVNTHRMLLRGHRIENIEEAKIVRVVSEAMQIEPLVVAPVVAVPLLLLLFLLYVVDDAIWGKYRNY